MITNNDIKKLKVVFRLLPTIRKSISWVDNGRLRPNG